MINKPLSPFQRFVSRLMVRFKLIKKVAVDIAEIDHLIRPQIPITLDVTIPGGKGELTVLDVKLSIPTAAVTLSAEVLCNFSVKFNHSIIYNTHLQLIIEAKPDYCTNTKTIKLTETKAVSMELISDEYSVIKDTRILIAGFLPEPLKSIFTTTFIVSAGILKSIGVSEMTRYLSLYLTGSKQRIIDYHHKEIEQKIIHFTQSDDFSYPMDETNFEEQLFAEFGQQVAIEQGQLFFIFHSNR